MAKSGEKTALKKGKNTEKVASDKVTKDKSKKSKSAKTDSEKHSTLSSKSPKVALDPTISSLFANSVSVYSGISLQKAYNTIAGP